MNDAELRSLERICSKDDLSDNNVATLVCLGLKAADEVRRLRREIAGKAALIEDMQEAMAERGQLIADKHALPAAIARRLQSVVGAMWSESYCNEVAAKLVAKEGE